MKNKIMLSVIMSTYNENKKELSKAIESVLHQSFQDFEFIIILDNPKNNEHVKIIEEYKRKDKRIRFYINEKNIGLAESLNKGINYSKSKIIARMDADDICLPNRFEEEFKLLKNENVDIVSTGVIYIDEFDNVINKKYDLPSDSGSINKILEFSSIIVHPSVMFKKERIEEIGKYRPFPCSQDYDLWLRALDYNLVFKIINKPLLKYRVRESGITGKNPLKQFIITEYIKALHKQRKRTGVDDFSIENLQRYLEKNNFEDSRKINKFRKSIYDIGEVKENIFNRKFLLSIFIIIKVFFRDKWSRKLIINYVKSYLVKRGIKK